MDLLKYAGPDENGTEVMGFIFYYHTNQLAFFVDLESEFHKKNFAAYEEQFC